MVAGRDPAESSARAPRPAPRGVRRGGGAAVRQLPTVRLVARGVRRVRPAHLGDDRHVDDEGGWFRVRLPHGFGVLRAAHPVDQRTRRAVPVAGALGARGPVPGRLRPARGDRAAAARLAGVVRLPVGARRMAQVHRPVRRIPLGCGGIQSGRQSAAGAGPLRRRAPGVLRGRLDRRRPRRDRHRVGAVVATRSPRPSRAAARRRGPGSQRRPGPARRGAGHPLRAPQWRGRRRGSHHDGGRGPGQRAAARPGVQRPAARRARQPRAGDDAPGRGGARRAGTATRRRHLAGELVGHRSDHQPRRRRSDHRRRRRDPRTDPGRRGRDGARLHPRGTRRPSTRSSSGTA